MGKLIDKLQHVGHPNTGRLGFLSNARAAGPAARPAGIIVATDGPDAALAEAAASNGADAVLIHGWTPGTDLSAVTAALQPSGAVVGVDLTENAAAGTVKQAQAAGASFAIITQDNAAGLLFDELDQFDRVIAVDPPNDEMGYMMLRMQNVLPVQAALVRLPLRPEALTRLSVADYLRFRAVYESLQFPSLTMFAQQQAPAPEHVQTLVQLGADALIVPASGSAQELGAQVKALREALEKTPMPHREGAPVFLGGLVSATTGAGIPTEPEREPQREPERGPQRGPQRPQRGPQPEPEHE